MGAVRAASDPVVARSRRMWRRRTIQALLLIATAGLLGTTSAPAFKTAQPPGRWPGNPARITYWNATNYGWAVDKAVKAWNRSGAHLRFVEASSRDSAKVVIQYPQGPANDSGACNLFGFGTAAGKNGFFQHGVVLIRRTKNPTAWRCRFEAAGVVTHELGHVLGLAHESSRCAAMNPEYHGRAPEFCPVPEPNQWRCRLVERDDARGVVSLYRGTPNPPRRPAVCPAPLAPNP